MGLWFGVLRFATAGTVGFGPAFCLAVSGHGRKMGFAPG